MQIHLEPATDTARLIALPLQNASARGTRPLVAVPKRQPLVAMRAEVLGANRLETVVWLALGASALGALLACF